MRTINEANEANGAMDKGSECPYCRNCIKLGDEIRDRHRKDKSIVRCPHRGCRKEIVLVIVNKNRKGEKYIKEILEPNYN